MATQHYNLPTFTGEDSSKPISYKNMWTQAMTAIDTEMYAQDSDIMVNTAAIEQAESAITQIQAKEDGWDKGAALAAETWELRTGSRITTITSSISHTSMYSSLNKWIFRIGAVIPEITSNANLWSVNGNKAFIPLLQYTGQAGNFGFNFNGSSTATGVITSGVLNLGYSTLSSNKYCGIMAVSDGTNVYILIQPSGALPFPGGSVAFSVTYIPTGTAFPTTD